MIPRLVTALIFLFCGVMTALLIRSVLNPLGTGLSEVSPGTAFDRFGTRGGPSYLDVWEGKRIIGKCEINPIGSIVRTDRDHASVKVRLSLLLLLSQPIMEAGAIKLEGDLQFHSDGGMSDLNLQFSLRGSQPAIVLHIRQPADEARPSFELTRGGGEVLLRIKPGEASGGDMATFVDTLLKSTGLPLDTLAGESGSAESKATVYAGHFQAGGSSHDGYILASGDDPATRLVLYMANTGEILRIDTPLTGRDQRGLRFEAESLCPSETTRPNFDETRFYKPRAP